MKKKIVAIFVCMLVAICSAFTVVASISVEKQRLVNQSNSSKQGCNTLITELYTNRVIEVDSGGTIVWQKAGLGFPVDAERLENGNTLIAELLGGRVIEVDTGGAIVWEYAAGLDGPWDAERLANGNTLITDTYTNRVIEVDSGGTIVWEKAGLLFSVDAERLENGNTLIAETDANRVIEVDSSGTIVWEKAGLDTPVDVERLGNGNTLITELSLYGASVTEVDSSGNIVWEYPGLGVFDAERLANGNTLITEFYYGNRVIEVDSSGTIVWQKAGLISPVDAERINNPPEAPTIDGQTSGKTGKEYEYTFNATDPDGDDVKYFIDWGDNDTDETGFNASGTEVIVKHKWTEDGNYNITAKAEDIHGAQGPEGTLTVTMPRNKPSNFNFNMLEWFFERFPNVFLLLRYILGLQ